MILSQVDLTEASQETDLDRIRHIIAAAFWLWYASHKDTKLTTIKVWFISKTVKVRDIESVFEMLFGPAPI
jgi:hypothetical protein